MLQLPENWDESTLRWINTLWRGNWREDSIGEEAVMDTAGIVRAKPRPAVVTLSGAYYEQTRFDSSVGVITS